MDQLQQYPTLVIAAAIVIAALVLGGVIYKISQDNRCRPVAIQIQNPNYAPGSAAADYPKTIEGLRTPPGC